MIEGIPTWAVVLDYLLGVVMWTLVGRFGMRIILPEDSKSWPEGGGTARPSEAIWSRALS